MAVGLLARIVRMARLRGGRDRADIRGRPVSTIVSDRTEVSMAKRLYVGNLPYTASEDDVRQLFSQAGTVESVSLPADRQTGQSRGFGFVDMASNEDADNAIRMFDGYRMDGRQLRVNVAREREERGFGGGYGDRRGGFGGGRNRRGGPGGNRRY